MEYLSPRDGGLLQNQGVEPSSKRVRAELLLAALFISVTLGLMLVCERLAQASPVPVVRVMVDREKTSLRINGFDLVARAGESDQTLAMARGRGAIEVKCALGGNLSITVGRKKAQLESPLHVTSLGGFIRVGESQYRDDLYVYSFNGDCIVVNHVDIEKYVAGLLNSEMSSHWSINALKAQAVAARTYAIYQMKEAASTRFRGLKPPFDVEGSVRDQVYRGAHEERYNTIRAVQATRGEVLSYKGEPIKAFYHSTCGGKTESPEQVWGMKLPYMRQVICGNCDKSPRFNWVYDIKMAEFEKKLRDERLLSGTLKTIRIIERNKLGRASRLEIVGSSGTMVVNATRIRDLVGTVNVRSTNFELTARDGKVAFIGHGSGHGVGMCQWGAKRMGDRGSDYAQILKHYYPAANLTRLY